MRLSGTNELIAIAVVILVTCFSPSLVSPLVRSHVGKAVALAATAWVSLHVSPHLALFLAVLVVSCCSGWEHYTVKKEEKEDKTKGTPSA
jgi:DMSO/TMAO reductase YedYZ heme-binding membrane subunit